MAYYLVSAKPIVPRMEDLESKLSERAFEGLQPFGRALTASLESARRRPDGTAVWEEEDYCRPPLAQERAAVLDRYFEQISVEAVERDGGWKRIADLPALFPALAGS
ncbi:MAG TPA: hypothetical protein VFH40_00740 [Gemmatimonadales bacterium]|jgi:hypothetical protein|nr:hypothetical protein [Gemmatimonadales bacterium]